MELGQVTGTFYGAKVASVAEIEVIARGEDGFDMTSPERSLEAYARLRSVPDLRVGITQKGGRMVLEYHIW